MAVEAATKPGVEPQVDERQRERRSHQLVEILRWARKEAAEADELVSRLPYLEDDERARVRHALVGRAVRRCLIPGTVSQALGLAQSATWAAVALLGTASTALALAAAVGLGPHLTDQVALGIGSRRIALIVSLAGAAGVGMLLTVPRWRIIPTIIRDALRDRDRAVRRRRTEAYLVFEWACLAVVMVCGVLGAATSLAVAFAGAWGTRDHTALALGCGLLGGLSGMLWSRLGSRVGCRMFGFVPRIRDDDWALLGLALSARGCADLLGGAWRRPGAPASFRRLVLACADLAESPAPGARGLRWFELREKGQRRRKYRMLGTIMRSHAIAALDAGTKADWERICQSLVSGLVLMTDGEWADLLVQHASIPRRDRWLARFAPRLLTALVTGVAAVFLPMLPGLDHTAGSSVRVFLAVAAVLALLPTGGGYDQVRTALSSALPWRSPK